ncbi:AF-9 homolog [Seminavis robusta]|uniref:AF-9 homolog n=1 Tax=Seminavis robusta TaxID=568900 RepID=A0A9N8DCR3_9STRA|nr:AF-9 homolog [Seminavis robusta]|eukprot:Sro80_g043030.1 AF-9 homolog (263) ;mRNA; f:47634-48572
MSGTSTDQSNNSKQPLKRLEKTTACLPIVYGSVAFFLGKKADEFKTHQWTLYVRGPKNEDLSGVIEKVVFQLHASFAEPTREILQPPFEVTECGWGEFEAQIKIVWAKEAQEMDALLAHGIKLYPPAPPGTAPSALPTSNPNVPVVSESYDEVVFTDPTEQYYRDLLEVGKLKPVTLKEERVQAAVAEYNDEQTFLQLLEAKQFLTQELQQVKSRFQRVDTETKDIDSSIRKLQEKVRASRKKPPPSSARSAPATAAKKQKS